MILIEGAAIAYNSASSHLGLERRYRDRAGFSTGFPKCIHLALQRRTLIRWSGETACSTDVTHERSERNGNLYTHA